VLCGPDLFIDALLRNASKFDMIDGASGKYVYLSLRNVRSDITYPWLSADKHIPSKSTLDAYQNLMQVRLQHKFFTMVYRHFRLRLYLYNGRYSIRLLHTPAAHWCLFYSGVMEICTLPCDVYLLCHRCGCIVLQSMCDFIFPLKLISKLGFRLKSKLDPKFQF